MPLSEEELRLLEQMERALVEEDPKLASTLRGTSLRRSARRRAIVAGVCFALGVAVLMTGAILSGDNPKFWALGILGFVLALLKHEGAFALLGKDTRTAGYESPFGTWWFNGVHYTTRDAAVAGPMP